MSTSPLCYLPAGVLALALLGGCGTPAPDNATPAPASASASTASSDAAWADKFCGAIVTFQNAAKNQPKIDESSPKKALTGLQAYIDQFTASLDTAVADLRSAGPAPVPAGDAAVTALTTYLNAARASFAKAKATLDKANPNDPSSISAAMAPLAGLQEPADPLKNLNEDPRLDAAAAQAPNCRTLGASG